MRHFIRTLILCIAAMISALPLCAYSPPADSTYTVSLITCAPGSEIYELEGHTGLRIRGNGLDVVANWGLFDFDSPGFVYRFVKGETDYSIGIHPSQQFLSAYQLQGRRVIEQKLNLTPQQTERLMQLIELNLRPGNRIYRYNYVKDNCATRPLRMVELALADSVVLGQAPYGLSAEGTTFRKVMQTYHRNYPWYQFGIDLALGSGLDHPITNREVSFAPDALAIMMKDARIGMTGEPVALSTDIIYEGVPGGITLGPTPWFLSPVFVFWVVFAFVALVTWADIVRRRVSRWLDATMFGIFGLAGCLVAFLIFISVHEASSPNWIALWLNPLCFIVPIFVWIKCARRFLMCYYFANFAALIAFAVIWATKNQTGNFAFIPLMLCDAIRSLSYIYITRWEIKRTVSSRRNFLAH